MLHYSAVTGGFVCHVFVHLQDFRQWAAGRAVQIFCATESTRRRRRLLMRAGAAQRPRAQLQRGGRARPGSTPLALVDPAPVRTPTRMPLHLHRGLGEAALILLHAAGHATAQQTLWTWSGKRHARCYRTQQSSLAPTRTDNSGALLGKENLPGVLTPLLLL